MMTEPDRIARAVGAAQWLAGQGFGVVAVHHLTPDGHCSCSAGAACPSPAKHPIGTDWQKRATRSAATIAKLVGEHGQYGVVPWPGDRGLILDVDHRERLGLVLPASFRVTRGAARGHAYFRLPEGVDPRTLPATAPFGEVRVEGASRHVVGPYSRHASGDTYIPHGDAINEIPRDVLQRLLPPKPTVVAGNGSSAYGLPDPGYTGSRYEAIRDFVASRYKRGISAQEIWLGVVDVLAPRFAEPLAVADLRSRFERAMTGTGARLGPPMPEPIKDTRVSPGRRALRLVAASSVTVRPVHWAWDGRLACGSVSLLGGREGIGKTTLGNQLAADITRGRLPGVYFGQPKGVIIAASEDSWEHTIVPRLMAADADLDRVFRVDVTSSDSIATELSLPRDVAALEAAIVEADVALVLLDPLMSRLDASLDTHRDAEVRLALEPIAAVANRTGVVVLGLIHVNKGGSADPLTALMGSRAFAAVARAVLFVMVDPDDDSVRLLGQPKNNLGRADLTTLTFRIESAHVADTPEGPVYTGKLVWTGTTDVTIREAMTTAGDADDTRTAATEATDWLLDYLKSQGGAAEFVDVRREAGRAGHNLTSVQRARKRAAVKTIARGFPRRTRWELPVMSPQSVRPVMSPLGRVK